jgi:hypothetical protein
MRTSLTVALPLLGALLCMSAANAATDGQRCAAAKLRAAAKKGQGLLTCHASAVTRGTPVDASCLNRVKAKFATKWAAIEAKGGCATVGDVDAIEGHVDTFVDVLLGALPPTTSTTTSTTSTSTTSCPPPTAFYCGIGAGSGGTGACPGSFPFPALCPVGMACESTGPTSCTCVGDPVPCGNIRLPLCQYGTCPAGQTCKADTGSGTCPPACGCQ